MSPFRWFFGLLAGIGFALALVVHLLALGGVPVQQHVPWVWALHVGAFVVFIPAVFFLRRAPGKEPLGIFSGMPVWAGVALVLLFLYAFFNFFASLSAIGGASPEYRNGTYVLQSKGRVIREISEGEYRSGQAAQLRAFSGHWLLFYAVPFVVFLVRRAPNEV